MRITKLHLLLLFVAAGFAVFFAYQYHEEKQRQLAVLQEQKRKAEEEARALAELERVKSSAIKAVAVAGEYWLKGRRDGMDVSGGQQTLRQAKELLMLEKYGEAEALARQSIEELKTAKPLAVRYMVRRGDSLWKIAKMEQHYGKGSMWPVIWRANEKAIPDFDVIRARLVLVIPKTAEEIKKFSKHGKI